MPNSPKVENLDEKIYVLCYIKPRWVTELAEFFYGPDEISIRDNKSTVSNKVNELVNRGWLKVDKSYNKKVMALMKLMKEPIDERKISNRKYVTYSSLNPIREKININWNDTGNLTAVLKNPDFRKLIKDDIRSFDDIIGTLAGLIILSYQIKGNTSSSNKFSSAIDKVIREQSTIATEIGGKQFSKENIFKTVRLIENSINNFSDEGKREIAEAYKYKDILASVGFNMAVLIESSKK